jgi:hypothetical protein
VAGIKPGDPRRQRIITRAKNPLDLEPVFFEQLLQAAECEYTHVLPTGRLRVTLAPIDSSRIAEASDSARDVRQRERLPAEEQRTNVVPARKILGRDDERSVWRKHTCALTHECIGVVHVLNDLVAEHDVEGAILVGKTVFDPPDVNLNASRPSLARAVYDRLEPVKILCVGSRGKLQRSEAIVAANIEELVAFMSARQCLDVRKVMHHCVVECGGCPPLDCTDHFCAFNQISTPP